MTTVGMIGGVADYLHSPGLYEVTIVISTILIITLLRWIMDPYLKYKSRKVMKDYEFYECDPVTKTLKKQEGKSSPYLVSDSERATSAGGEPDDLCDLSLVIPAYNEESRLPTALTEHIEYLVRR